MVGNMVYAEILIIRSDFIMVVKEHCYSSLCGFGQLTLEYTMLFFNACFLHYYFYFIKKREEPLFSRIPTKQKQLSPQADCSVRLQISNGQTSGR